MTDDPKRLREDPSADAELRALIDAGAAELPHAEQLDALETKLWPKLGGPGGGGGGGGGVAAGAKGALAAAVVTAVVLGGTYLAMPPAPAAPPARSLRRVEADAGSP